MVVVADRWDVTLGGRERYAHDLVAHLTGEGWPVTKAIRSQRPVQDGRPVLALTPVRYATHYQLHSGLAAAAFAAERVSFDSAVRRALYRAGLRLNRRRQQLMLEEASLLAGTAALMAFSRSDARALVEHHGVAADRVTVSRPGVDRRCFHPPAGAAREAGEPMRLAFVAHNFALKGLKSAIQAVARVTQWGVEASLSVAGRGHRAAYLRLAAALRVSDRVRFLGSLSQTETADLYRASDALIHPTFYDPFPRVAIEALASGCPVITTAACGASEILTSGADGFVVADGTDIEQLARAVAALAHRSTLTRMRDAAAENGRRFDQAIHFRDMLKWLFDAHSRQ